NRGSRENDSRDGKRQERRFDDRPARSSDRDAPRFDNRRADASDFDNSSSRGKGYKPSGRPAAGKPADTRGSDKPKSRYAGKPSGTSAAKPAGYTAGKPAGRAGSKPPYKSKNTSGGGYARRRSAA